MININVFKNICPSLLSVAIVFLNVSGSWQSHEIPCNSVKLGIDAITACCSDSEMIFVSVYTHRQ